MNFFLGRSKTKKTKTKTETENKQLAKSPAETPSSYKRYLPSSAMKCLDLRLQTTDPESAWQLLGWFFYSLNLLVRDTNPGGSCREKEQLHALQTTLTDNLQPLLPIQNILFNDKKKFRSSTQRLVITTEIVGQGQSGTIRSAKYKGLPIVVKVPNSIQKNSTVLVESLLHSLLGCQQHIKAYMDKTIPGLFLSHPEYPIADIVFIARTEAQSLLVGLQRLDTTLTALIAGRAFTKDEFVDILFQITTKLYYMQEEFGFMHRDLHTDNIMICRRAHPIHVHCGFGGTTRTFKSTYRCYFIDFGMSCVDFSKCQSCDWASRITPGSPYGLVMCEQVPCENFTFDLRYMFGFIHCNLRGFLPFLQKDDILDRLLTQTVDDIDLSMYPLKIRKSLDRHKVIVSAIDREVQRYHPLHVLREILRM